MKNIVLFGAPGAGKGTQAALLQKKYAWVHVATGDIFRYHIQKKTHLGTIAKSYIDKGDLVPDEITVNMLKAAVEKNKASEGFLFDGFPRTVSQAKALDAFLKEKNKAIDAMIALEVPEDILLNRILERGKISGRSDDQDVTKIKNRFNEYRTKTNPVKDYYKQSQKYYEVDGTGSISQITALLIQLINSLK